MIFVVVDKRNPLWISDLNPQYRYNRGGFTNVVCIIGYGCTQVVAKSPVNIRLTNQLQLQHKPFKILL